jgi:hypothetical protein
MTNFRKTKINRVTMGLLFALSLIGLIAQAAPIYVHTSQLKLVL